MRSWVDGTVLDGRDAHAAVRAGDPMSLGAGDGVFTTVLVENGRARSWGRHMRRLEASADGLGLGDVDLEQVRQAAREASAAGLPARARLRVLWGRGAAGGHLSLQISELAQPESSVRVMSPSVRRTSSALLGAHKSSHYAENLVALAEARRAGAHEALLVTEADHLCEGTGSNVFYVVEGELRTPALSTGCLPGIARSVVLDLVGAAEVEEHVLEAQRASECFLTSSTREVQPVAQWGGRSFDAPGPVASRARARWREFYEDPSQSLLLT